MPLGFQITGLQGRADEFQGVVSGGQQRRVLLRAERGMLDPVSEAAQGHVCEGPRGRHVGPREAEDAIQARFGERMGRRFNGGRERALRVKQSGKAAQTYAEQFSGIMDGPQVIAEARHFPQQGVLREVRVRQVCRGLMNQDPQQVHHVCRQGRQGGGAIEIEVGDDPPVQCDGVQQVTDPCVIR